MRWFREAAEQGNPQAQYDLGVMFQLGRGVAQDSAAAVRWYLEAAEHGYPEAQFNLAVRHTEGPWCPARTTARRVRLYRAAAEQGL